MSDIKPKRPEIDIKLDMTAEGKVRVNATLNTERGIESHMFFEGDDIAEALEGLVKRYDEMQKAVVDKLEQLKLISFPDEAKPENMS